MNDELFIEIVNKCKTMTSAAKIVGMSYRRFVNKAKKLNCYRPNQGSKGISRGRKTRKSTKDILEGKYPEFQTYKLKLRLIEENYLQDKCYKCGWNEKPDGSKFTPCELDHINGDPKDHRLENLQLICPNCHSLTRTYRFRRGKTNGNEHQEEKSLE